MTDLCAKRPAETKVSRLDSEHLLETHPSSWVGSAATPLPLLDFLGSHSKIHRSLHAHTMAKILRELGSRGKQGSSDLEA